MGHWERARDDRVGVAAMRIVPSHEALYDRAAALERDRALLPVGAELAFFRRRVPGADGTKIADLLPEIGGRERGGRRKLRLGRETGDGRSGERRDGDDRQGNAHLGSFL